jgi:MarR family 2-MHQ and catechol resistance regulon transcriptional repressor
MSDTDRPAPTAAEQYLLLRETTAHLDRITHHAAEATGLHPALLDLLLRLAENPTDTMRPVQLADLLGVTSGGITRIIDRAEAKGLVTRAATKNDQRGFDIRLTTLGRERADKATADLAGAERAWSDQVVAEALLLHNDLIAEVPT